jgi:hypothetical protein
MTDLLSLFKKNVEGMKHSISVCVSTSSLRANSERRGIDELPKRLQPVARDRKGFFFFVQAWPSENGRWRGGGAGPH